MINDQVEVGDFFLDTFLKETSAELNHVCFWETHQTGYWQFRLSPPTQHTFCQHQYPSQSKSFRAGRDVLSFQTKQNTNYYYYYKAHLVQKERVDMIQVNVQTGRSDRKKKDKNAGSNLWGYM